MFNISDNVQDKITLFIDDSMEERKGVVCVLNGGLHFVSKDRFCLITYEVFNPVLVLFF